MQSRVRGNKDIIDLKVYIIQSLIYKRNELIKVLKVTKALIIYSAKLKVL